MAHLMSAPHFDRVLPGIIRWLVRHRRFAVLCAMLLASGMGVFASRLGVDNSLEVWFVKDDPTLASYRNFQEQFGNDELVVTVMHGSGDVFDTGRLARLMHFTRALESIDGVAQVRTLANASITRQSVFGPSVVPVIDSPVERDDVERAREAVSISGDGSAFVGEDGKSLVVYTWLEAAPDIDARRGPILDDMRSAADAAIAGTGERVSHGGVGVLHDALNRATLSEGAVYIGFSYLVIAIVLYLITRRWLWTVLALLAVTCADLALLGTMSLLGRPINMITIALPPLVMILGVANVVHMATDLDNSLASKQNRLSDLSTCLAGISVPCLFNAVTTAVAFLSLTTASMAVTRDYGLFAALGVVFAFVFSLVGMSALLPRVAHFRSPGRMHAWMKTLVERVMLFAVRWRGVVVTVAVLLVVISVVGAGRIVVDTYSIGFLPEDHTVRVDSDAIEDAVGPYLPLELTLQVTDADDWKRADFLAHVATMQAALEADSAIGRTTTVGNVLRDLYVALTGQTVERLWAPEEDSEVDGLLSLIKKSGDHRALQSFVAEDDRTLRLAGTTVMASARELTTVANRAKQTAERVSAPGVDVALSGYLPLYGQIIVHTLDDQVKSFTLAFLMVFLVIAIVLRSWRFTLVAIPPNLLPVAVVLGVMGFARIQLDIATVTVAAVVLGIIVDDTVHILYRLRRELADGRSLEAAMRSVARASGVAVFSTSIVFFCGFLIIALAGTTAVANPGLLTAVAVFAALVTDLALLPAFASYLFGKRSGAGAAAIASAHGPEPSLTKRKHRTTDDRRPLRLSYSSKLRRGSSHGDRF
ncbi:MAG: efflux RND transporter permease subunit [Candidatus Krumholzibacteria bacterium]|nr:efflux RND transporter permease subunit [Candidatus Krumholzibacteria bacterium]